MQQGQEIGEVGDTGSPGSLHLHFEVLSASIDPKSAFQGVPGVIVSNGRKSINPLCFVENDKMTINAQSKACTTVCSASSCASNPGCTGTECAYKFCGLYEGILPKNSVCQPKENTDWKISNSLASLQSASGDKTITLYTTIENPEDECASITPAPMITMPGGSSYNPKGDEVNVYKKDDKNKYVNLEVECSFITDKAKLAEERKSGKCVLLAPSDSGKLKYIFKSRPIL